MRTNVEIDDALMTAGLSTERAPVKESLRLLVRAHEQAYALADLRGWGGTEICARAAHPGA